MNLWINFYLDPKRNHELLYCLQNNIENPLIKKIYLVGEINYEDEKVVFINQAYKVDSTVSVKRERPTFGNFLTQIFIHEPDEINIIANADIYFDETLGLAKNIKDGECYALSRWDETREGLKHFNTRDSQDAFLIKGIFQINDCKFSQGVAGCDNAFAERLHSAGYKVSNPSLDIRAIHVHANNQTQWRTGERVPLPYLLITPHRLGEEPSIQHITKPY